MAPTNKIKGPCFYCCGMGHYLSKCPYRRLALRKSTAAQNWDRSMEQLLTRQSQIIQDLAQGIQELQQVNTALVQGHQHEKALQDYQLYKPQDEEGDVSDDTKARTRDALKDSSL